MDLFINDASDISAGNMRSQSQDQMNEAIQQHNQQITSNINSIQKNLADQTSTIDENEALKEIAGGVEDLMGFKGVKEGFKSYQQWQKTRTNKMNALAKSVNEAPEGISGNVRVGVEDNATPSVEQPENTTTEPPETSVPEGTPATPSTNTSPSTEDHESITVGEDGEGKTGSMIHNGIKNITGLSDEAIENVGKGAGVLASGITGGIDIFKDIKSGGIAGDNGFEKVGNVTQIGASISDIVGVAFPPAELLGGLLSVIGGGLDAIGEAVEGSDKRQETQKTAQEQTQQQQEQVQAPIIQAQAPKVALSRTQ